MLLIYDSVSTSVHSTSSSDAQLVEGTNYTYSIQFSRTWLGKRIVEKVRVDRRKFNVVVIASEFYVVKSPTYRREHANTPY